MSQNKSTGRKLVNKHGRKPTRGLRPWLLIPKLLGAATCFGGSAAAVAICRMESIRLAADPARAIQEHIPGLLGVLFVGLIVPGMLLAILLGLTLCWHHRPGVMLRQRWLQVKLVALGILIPIGHVAMSEQLALVYDAAKQSTTGADAASAIGRFELGLWLTLTSVAVVIVLGRIKPKLGQNWAKAFAKTKAARKANKAAAEST